MAIYALIASPGYVDTFWVAYQSKNKVQERNQTFFQYENDLLSCTDVFLRHCCTRISTYQLAIDTKNRRGSFYALITKRLP